MAELNTLNAGLDLLLPLETTLRPLTTAANLGDKLAEQLFTLLE